MKGKNNSILAKALNEADTIRAGALKNAQDLLFSAFEPQFKKMWNNVLSEQVGVHNQDPMDGPEDGKYHQTEKEADLVNPEKAMHKEGDGPELLEQEEFDDELEENNIAEQDEDEEDLEEGSISEQDDEEDDEFLEQLDIDDDLEMDEQEEEEDDFEIEEQADDEDDFDLDEAADDEEELEEDAVIEVVDDISEAEEDDELDEQQAVTVAKDKASIQAANESLKKKLRNALTENKKLEAGIAKLSSRINEVNLFNAKVACANRIISTKTVNENVKKSALKTLDKCKTIKEIKITYLNFKNFASANRNKGTNIHETRNINAMKNRTSGLKPSNTASKAENNKMLRLAGLSD